MRRSPTTPSLHELLKSGLGARRHYASSRDLLQFIAGSTLDGLIAPVLEELGAEETWELTMTLAGASAGSPTDRAPLDRAARRSDADAPACDPEPESEARLVHARG